MLRVRLRRAGSLPGVCSGQAGKDAGVGALLQSPPGHGSPLRSAASAPLTPSPRILLSLPRSSRRQRRKQSRFLKSWGREDFRAMGGRERRASGLRGWKPGHRRKTPDPDGRSWWEHMLRPQRSSLRRPLRSSGSPELSNRLQPRLFNVDGSASSVLSPISPPRSGLRGGCAASGDARRCQEIIIIKNKKRQEKGKGEGAADCAPRLRSCQPGDGEPVPSVCGGAASEL